MTTRIEEFSVDFQAAEGMVMSDLSQALRMVAEDILTVSKSEYVPVDTGMLKGSGTTGEPQITPDGISVEIGYGGAAVPYALRVHEAPDVKADGSPWGQGKNKYLTKPLYAMAADLPRRLGKYATDAMNRRS